MGSLNFVAARSANDRPEISYFDGSEANLLKRFGAGWTWKYIVAGCRWHNSFEYWHANLTCRS